MRATDYLAGALEDIRATKLRSFLTSLGIIIGVGSVVLMMSIGEGFNSTLTGAFSELGSTRITVSPSAPNSGDSDRDGGFEGGGGGPMGGVGVASTLTVADAEALSGVEGVAAAAPVTGVSAKVSGEAKTLDLAVTGTTPSYQEAMDQETVSGRMFRADSDEIVLNQEAAEQLFGDAAPVGETVGIDEESFTVVGVFANESSPFPQGGPGADAGEQQTDAAVFVPVQRALGIAGTENVSQMVLTAESPEQVEATVERVREMMLERHNGVQDFSISSLQELRNSFTQISDNLTVFLAAIAGISLLVGGIGIMNIMLVTVTERTREIGIAKAIGATRANVIVQFLVEAVLLSLLGGALGLVVAWVGTVLVEQIWDLPAIVTPFAVLLALGVSALIGIFFGVVPAWRAARLDPIVALRHE